MLRYWIRATVQRCIKTERDPVSSCKIKKLIGFPSDPYCIIGFLVEGCLCKACGGSTMRMSLMWFHIFFCVALFGTSSNWSNASISVRRRHCLHLTPSLWVDSIAPCWPWANYGTAQSRKPTENRVFWQPMSWPDQRDEEVMFLLPAFLCL